MDDGDEQVSWLAASSYITFPTAQTISGFDASHTAYSCGGSPGIAPEFPLNPGRRTPAQELITRGHTGGFFRCSQPRPHGVARLNNRM